MGQQQLIIVIIVSILIGIATIVAINTYEKARESANLDAIRQQVLSSYNLAISHYDRPAMLGGGGGSFNGINKNIINLPDSTADGVYILEIDGANNQEIKIIVTPNSNISSVTFTITPSTISSEID